MIVRALTLGDLRAARWRHQVSARGEAQSFVSCIDPPGAYVLVSRIGNLTIPGAKGWGEQDDEYARNEFRALVISWLNGLGQRVIDGPGGNSLAGADGGEWRERRIALECGFALEPVYAVSRAKHAPWSGASAKGDEPGERAEALVVGDALFGCPDGAGDSCLRLARRLGLDTLKVRLSRGGGCWRFAGCERLPELGGGALAALADLAEARAG